MAAGASTSDLVVAALAAGVGAVAVAVTGLLLTSAYRGLRVREQSAKELRQLIAMLSETLPEEEEHVPALYALLKLREVPVSRLAFDKELRGHISAILEALEPESTRHKRGFHPEA